MKKYNVLTEISDSKIIAVIRGGSRERLEQCAEALLSGGVRCCELPLCGVDARVALENLALKHESGDLLLGAGTVTDAETARIAILSGARFLVTPTVSQKVIAMGNRYGVPVITGAFTPTEISLALEYGSDVIKLFPATQLTPRVIGDLKAPFPMSEFVPMGGITVANAREWLKAGAFALGVGGALTVGDSFDEIADNAKRFIAQLKSALLNN